MSKQTVAPSLASGKRVVIKIGSALLVDAKTGAFHDVWLNSFIEDIAYYHQQNQQILIVSSGAISLGRQVLNLKAGPLQLEQQQAAAAAGQIRLAYAFQKLLAVHEIKVAQILLTLDDSENRRRYINAKNTLETLLKSNVIPIINENDTVTTAEIRYGDNDRLAARVAQMIVADRLILLSDIDGLYTRDPQKYKTAQFIPLVTELSPEIKSMASEPNSQYGTGGMVTKLSAAKIAMGSGCCMAITNGKDLHALRKIDQGKPCTWFIPKTNSIRARKNWIRHHLKSQGRVIINPGAITALENGKSLLSAGVMAIDGNFQKGDVVSVYTPEQREIARGLCNYPSYEARKIIGKKSSQIAAILGYLGSEELIHRDDLVIL